MTYSAAAAAHPNIAFIKYWGNRDPSLRLPVNGSISMTLGALETRTKVVFDPDLEKDQLTINGSPIEGAGLGRVSKFLDRVREMSGVSFKACVVSWNTFPMGSGIASSASAFAALSLAASAACDLSLSEDELSRLARTGSGSACRSVPGGYVEWEAGTGHEDSYAATIAPPEHWDLVDHVVVVSEEHKKTGSTAGHQLAETSPLQQARVADSSRRLDRCRRAIQERDFEAFCEVVEQDSNMMHAVMMTSQPQLLYWRPETLRVLHAVREWRQEGWSACCTVDAGPNVHVLCPKENAGEIEQRLRKLSGIKDVLTSPPGRGVRLLSPGGDRV